MKIDQAIETMSGLPGQHERSKGAGYEETSSMVSGLRGLAFNFLRCDSIVKETITDTITAVFNIEEAITGCA